MTGIIPIVAAAPAHAVEPLSWLTATTDPALHKTLDRLHPDLAALAEYHKSWADANGRPVTGGGHGKCIRADLACAATLVGQAGPLLGHATNVPGTTYKPTPFFNGWNCLTAPKR